MSNVYKFGKLKLWQKYVESLHASHPLTHLFWECTLRCNLACRHCGSYCSPDILNKSELTTEEIKNGLTKIANNFNPKKIFISVTGGEPLLRNDVFEVMKYATGLGFKWGMVTNGTLVDEITVQRMINANISTISISVDGLKEEHDWMRGKESFDKTLIALDALAKKNLIDKTEVITCVNQRNLNQLEDLLQFLNNHKINMWRIGTIVPIGRANNNQKLFLDCNQYQYLLKFIQKRRKEKNTSIKIEYCDEGFLGEEYEGNVRNCYFFCNAGITTGSILYNGDIGACPILPRKITKQGNIKNEDFSKVWKEKYQMFRKPEWKKQGICKSCTEWNFCKGNSMHLWDFEKNQVKKCNYNILNL